jgi:hypothetical protein
MVIIRIIPRPMVMPPRNSIHQPRWVQALHPRRELQFRTRGELAPSFVIDDPGVDGGEGFVGVD